MLKFDKVGLANEILNKLENELRWALKAWEDEVYNHLRYREFADSADVDFKLKKETNTIVAYLKANVYVLADSYGTGSLMLTDNPGYQAYRNSSRWNPARKSNAIVGRPAGNYTNAFGEKKSSWGYLEGINLEGMRLKSGSGYVLKAIEPVHPSKALQIAEEWLYKTYLPKAYQNAIRNVDFAKYLIES